jgi:transposase-like protein
MLSNPIFSDDAAARAALEKLRWPEGPTCVHCHAGGRHVSKIVGTKKTHREGTFSCNGCRKQFTVTVGTMFERTRVPLSKWLYGLHLCSEYASDPIQDLRQNVFVDYKTASKMWAHIYAAARLYKGQLLAFGPNIRKVMNEKRSKAVRQGLTRYAAAKLKAAGRHPAQHTIRSEGVLLALTPTSPPNELKRTSLALSRTEALARLLLATDPKALMQLEQHMKRKGIKKVPTNLS